MKDDNCIFCKLANGDIPTNSIYEDDDFKVILDASPATKGHALILPKQHYANIFEIEDETLAKAAKLAKKIMTHEKDVLGCERLQPGTEQWRGGRPDSIPFPYAPDSKI